MRLHQHHEGKEHHEHALESLRLWPTEPLVLRETTEETAWDTGVMPAGTGIVILAPFFHRDDRRLSCADRFTPDAFPALAT